MEISIALSNIKQIIDTVYLQPVTIGFTNVSPARYCKIFRKGILHLNFLTFDEIKPLTFKVMTST